MRLTGHPFRPGSASGRIHLFPEGIPLRQAVRSPPATIAAGPGFAPESEREAPLPYDGVILFDAPAESVPIELPTVWGVEGDLLREDDHVDLDGSTGEVELGGVDEVDVVTAFLQRADGRILLLRRSERVGSFQNSWAAVSGFLEGRSPQEQALREIEEECGVRRQQLRFVREGEPIHVRHGARMYVVHPVRFRTVEERIRLNWEHTEFQWILPEGIGQYGAVPKLDLAWASVSSASDSR